MRRRVTEMHVDPWNWPIEEPDRMVLLSDTEKSVKSKAKKFSKTRAETMRTCAALANVSIASLTCLRVFGIL